MVVHLLKTAVGIADLDQLARRQRERSETLETGGRAVRVLTRRMPRRSDEVLAGGSLYWIVKRRILARNRVIGFELAPPDAEGVRRCRILLDPALVAVSSVMRRPIQGWRYLTPADAPYDLPQTADATGDAMPRGLAEELRELGLL